MDNKKLLDLYPQYTSVLGPYLRPDGRKHIVLNNSNAPSGTKGKTKTISYPKALVEVSVGRRLLPNETVDHHNRNHTDDNVVDNLFIRSRSEHASLDVVRVTVENVDCPMCGASFTPSISQRNNHKAAGPFCSRKCSGLYGTEIQKGFPELERTEIKKTYYQERK